MKNFKNKVSVITGAASGIGLGIARRCVTEGIKVVLADIHEEALEKAKTDLEKIGGQVMAVLADVSKAEEIEMLARKTIDNFGQVNLLFNNAGVWNFGFRTWEFDVKDWEWVINVNLWGIIHAVRTFIPIMLKQNSEAHIVNTASLGGLITGAPAPYTVSKHAVVAFTEGLYREFALGNINIGVSVLCPGPVATHIADLESTTSRPKEYGGTITLTKDQNAFREMFEEITQKGISIDQCAEITFDAIMENRFYIFTNPEMTSLLHERLDDIRKEQNPSISPY